MIFTLQIYEISFIKNKQIHSIMLLQHHLLEQKDIYRD